MKDRRGSSKTTSWTKAALILSLVAAGIGAAWWFAPDRARELRECAAKCSPRSGGLVADPRFKNSFKADSYLGPMVCSCSYKKSRQMPIVIRHNMSLDTETQLQAAASPRGLCSGQLQRYASQEVS